jgi:autotransporter passenger strand-loop-strand repeat protein
LIDSLVPNGGSAVTGHAGGPAATLISGGSVDEPSIVYANLTSANINPVTDVLTVYSSAGVSSAVQLSGNLQSTSFALVSDAGGGTDIFDLGVSPQVNDPIPPGIAANQIIILAGSNLQFVNTLSTTVGQGYENAIVTAEAFYQSQIASTATLDFTFDMSSGVGAGVNSYTPVNASFSQLQAALANAATSADDRAAVAALASLAGEFGGQTFQVAEPLALLLGLPGASSGASDTTELDSTLNYFYSQANPVPGAFDAVAVLEHEISEGGLGRIGGDGSNPGPMDLFRYSAVGTPDATLGRDGAPAYFSIDGIHLLTEFHNPIAGNGSNDQTDSADWDSSGTFQQPTPVFGASSEWDAFGVAVAGEEGVVTSTDLRALDVLGWTLSGTTPITTVSSGQTATVGAGQSVSGVTVQSSGALDIGSGGVAQATVVSGGIEFVLSGGVDSGATLLAGGEQVVSGGAVASGATVQSGGFQLVRSGGLGSGTTVLSGGLERFYSGASAANLIVSSGGVLGTELVVSGGTTAAVTSTTETGAANVSGVIVMSGGIVEVQAATVMSGGFLALPAGATLPGLVNVSAGGALSGPGIVMGDVADAGVMDGGVVMGSSTTNKATVDVQSGGLASGVTVADNGELLVEPGGTVQGLILRAGATLDLVSVSGTAASVSAQGQLLVTSGGATVYSLAGVTAPGLAFSASSDGQGGTLLTTIAAPSDYNGDALGDLTWRNTNGDAGIWLTTSGGGHTPVDFGVIDNTWVIQDVGDFNGDGKADLLWRNTATGQVGEWLSKPGTGYAGFTMPILAAVATSWQIDGVGDFNGDGLSDLVWRNANGDAGIWLTTSGGGFTPVDFGVVTNAWQIQGAGDFNGDGKADLLWRNNTTGQVGEWLSKPGSGYQGFTMPILASVDLSWKIQGVGDFSGDGLSDLLWRNTNGDTGIWVTTSGGGYTPIDFGVISLNWQINGVGDYNGDGKADILWRNTVTGQVGEWLSKSGPGYQGFTTPILAAVDPSWKLQGVPPALQPNLVGSSVATFAQAMASLGTESSHAALLTASPAAAPATTLAALSAPTRASIAVP